MTNLLDEDLILLQSEAKNKNEVFHEFGDILINKGFAKNNYIEGLKEREIQFPTGIETGGISVALPHTDSTFIKESKIGFMSLKNPVEFGVMGGAEEQKVSVSVVFLIALADSNQHLQVLQKVIELIQNGKFLEKIQKTVSKEQAYEMLNQQLIYQLEEEVK